LLHKVFHHQQSTFPLNGSPIRDASPYDKLTHGSDEPQYSANRAAPLLGSDQQNCLGFTRAEMPSRIELHICLARENMNTGLTLSVGKREPHAWLISATVDEVVSGIGSPVPCET
jgi:hypothetical protein